MADGGSDRSREYRADVQAEAAAARAAVAALEGWGRGRPVQEVEVALANELRRRGSFMPPEQIHLEARYLTDPEWAQKDPEAVQRVLDDMSRPPSAEDQALEREWEATEERLEAALESMWRLKEVAMFSRRTIDGVEFEIQIDPWSARRAKKLQRIGSPAVVTVRPYDERDW
jgi:hypothetical protein